MNNKGFSVSGILYPVFLLIIIFVLLILYVLLNSKFALDQTIQEMIEAINNMLV